MEGYVKGVKDALDQLNDMSVHIPEDLVILYASYSHSLKSITSLTECFRVKTAYRHL